MKKISVDNQHSLSIKTCVLDVRFGEIGLRFTVAKQFENLCEGLIQSSVRDLHSWTQWK